MLVFGNILNVQFYCKAHHMAANIVVNSSEVTFIRTYSIEFTIFHQYRILWFLSRKW